MCQKVQAVLYILLCFDEIVHGGEIREALLGQEVFTHFLKDLAGCSIIGQHIFYQQTTLLGLGNAFDFFFCRAAFGLAGRLSFGSESHICRLIRTGPSPSQRRARPPLGDLA